MTPAMDNFDAVRNKALMVGGAGLGVCLIGGVVNPDQFFRSWLVAYLYWAAIPLGCFALLMLHHMVGGAWGIVIRRLLESGTRTIPLLAILVLPILVQLPRLYLWARPGVMETDHLLHEKAAYLNIPFFLGRTAFYFAVWMLLSWLLNKWSAQQDEGDAGAKGKLQQMAGPGLILYGLTVTFAVVDWVMSLEPHWYSTIYGVIFMVGQALAAIAFVTIALRLLSDRRPMSGLLKPSHFHDLGNLMLAFVMLWAYTNISQFIIIWMGNLPEETPWFYSRLNGGWGVIAVALVMLHWAIPFLILLVRKNKQQAKILASLAIFMLFMRLVDLIWVVAPSFHEHGISLHWLDLAAPVAVGGLWVAFFTWQLGRRPLEPVEAAELAAEDITMSTSPQGGYERTDADIPSVWKFIVGIFALIGVSLLLSLLLFRFLYRSEQADMPTATPMEARRVLPPAPRLQINGTVDLTEMRRKEEQALTSYGWVDKNAGVVRIPVDRAIDLIAGRGMPKGERTGAPKKQ